MQKINFSKQVLWELVFGHVTQGPSQEFATRVQKRSLGDGSSQLHPGVETWWGSGGKAPRSWRQMLISSYDGGT